MLLLYLTVRIAHVVSTFNAGNCCKTLTLELEKNDISKNDRRLQDNISCQNHLNKSKFCIDCVSLKGKRSIGIKFGLRRGRSGFH